MPSEEYEEYDVTFFLPTSAADAFATFCESTVSQFFWQVYGNALSWTHQDYGEELAVIIRLENYPLGTFVLAFKEEEEVTEVARRTPCRGHGSGQAGGRGVSPQSRPRAAVARLGATVAVGGRAGGESWRWRGRCTEPPWSVRCFPCVNTGASRPRWGHASRWLGTTVTGLACRERLAQPQPDRAICPQRPTEAVPPVVAQWWRWRTTRLSAPALKGQGLQPVSSIKRMREMTVAAFYERRVESLA